MYKIWPCYMVTEGPVLELVWRQMKYRSNAFNYVNSGQRPSIDFYLRVEDPNYLGRKDYRFSIKYRKQTDLSFFRFKI